MTEVHPDRMSEGERSRTGMVVNAGVVNIYREAAFQSEVVTQAILGETPEVLDQQGKWFQIQQWDGYRGWMYHFYLVKNPQYLNSRQRIKVNHLMTPIREEPSESAPCIRDAVFGTELPILARRESWVQVSLPDSTSGWLQHAELDLTGSIREQLVHIAELFLGVPYMWGGKTPRGFDCSGFVQTCYKRIGVILPRDASLQHRFQDLPDIGITEACPGDLFFFSEPGEGITHVAMSLGGGDIIHSSGWIKCESLDSNSSRYNHQLHSIFTTGKDVTRLLDAG